MYTDALTNACTHNPTGTHIYMKLMPIKLIFCSGSETREAVIYDWQFCYVGACCLALPEGHFLVYLSSSTENHFSECSGQSINVGPGDWV